MTLPDGVPTTNSLRVAVIGLGAMGYGMACSLLRAGMEVRGYDIAQAALQRFAAAGGSIATSPATAATGAHVVLVMVLNGEQVEQALFGAHGVTAALSPQPNTDRVERPPVIMVCSTVAPALIRNLATHLAALGIELLDAPVSGGVARAADGSLSVMASGSPAAFAAAAPVLDAIAANVYRMGNEPGQGATMKLINQVLAGIHIAAAAEAVAFGARAGIDPRHAYDVITHSAGNSWMFADRVPHILDDDFTPHSAVEIWLKDLGLILDTAKEMQLPVPLVATAQQLFIMAAAAGHGRLDDSAVVKVYEQLARFRVLDAVAQDSSHPTKHASS